VCNLFVYKFSAGLNLNYNKATLLLMMMTNFDGLPDKRKPSLRCVVIFFNRSTWSGPCVRASAGSLAETHFRRLFLLPPDRCFLIRYRMRIVVGLAQDRSGFLRESIRCGRSIRGPGWRRSACSARRRDKGRMITIGDRQA